MVKQQCPMRPQSKFMSAQVYLYVVDQWLKWHPKDEFSDPILKSEYFNEMRFINQSNS